MSLRAAFLSFVGRRSMAEVCRFYDLPYFLIQRWVNERSPLPPWLEADMRDRLKLDTAKDRQCPPPVSSAVADPTNACAAAAARA